MYSKNGSISSSSVFFVSSTAEITYLWNSCPKWAVVRSLTQCWNPALCTIAFNHQKGLTTFSQNGIKKIYSIKKTSMILFFPCCMNSYTRFCKDTIKNTYSRSTWPDRAECILMVNLKSSRVRFCHSLVMSPSSPFITLLFSRLFSYTTLTISIFLFVSELLKF